MAGIVQAIHVFLFAEMFELFPATSAGITVEVQNPDCPSLSASRLASAQGQSRG